MKAYHWLKSDMTSGAGGEKPWTIGETRTIKGEIELCERGYHSSKSFYDALRYAPGAMACIVEVSGETIKGGYKKTSSTRKLIDASDATKVLMEFDIDCAERVLPNFEKYYPNDGRPREAIKAARDFNKGLITQVELLASEAASEAAAKAASWSASWAAKEARSAKRSAARSAARSALWASEAAR